MFQFEDRSEVASDAMFAVSKFQLDALMPKSTNNPKRSMLDFSQLEQLARESGAIVKTCVWTLVRKSDTGADEHRTSISSKSMSIGRKPINDLRLSDPTVSGEHAILTIGNGTLHLKDLGSTNGTLVNGSRLLDECEVQEGDVIYFGQVCFTVERKVDQLTSSGGFSNKTCVGAVPEDAILYKGFDQLLNKPDIEPHFQPIVNLRGEQETIGYEVLVRSRIKGLEFPDRIFKIAAMRLSEAKLSEVCRSEGLLHGIQIDPGSRFFLNTHAAEVETPRLIQSLRALRHDFPNMAIVLEIHEAAITSVKYLVELSEVLNELNIELAFDDFGAGQARLIELFEVPPKYLKFDLSFVRGLESASKLHRASVRALLNMVRDLDVISLAEGVETQEMADLCAELGFDTAQGYFFDRPQPVLYWLERLASAATVVGLPSTSRTLQPGKFGL